MGTKIRVCGKWILAGEYAVLKSYPALAFPLPSQFIEMNYTKKKEALRIEAEVTTTISQRIKESAFVSNFEFILNQGLKKIFKKPAELTGTIKLQCCVIFSAGIGTSSIICVLVGRLFHFLNWLTKEQLFYFCHSLENSLHGQSSGVDVAAVLTQKPILFSNSLNKEGTQKAPKIEVLQTQWQPNIFLSYAGEGNTTKENIEKMKFFWDAHPEKSDQLNQKMGLAVLKAKEGLESKDENQGIMCLKEAFSLAEQCFAEWNLIGDNMKKHILLLKKQGALAVKPTGSGSGGFVLSLWSQSPPGNVRSQLISAF